MNSILAGLVVLILGDSHMVHQGGLIDLLPDQLAAEGATVYAYGACGATPTDYLTPKTTDCGRTARAGTGAVTRETGMGLAVWNARDLIAKTKPDLIVVVMGDTMGAYKTPVFPKAWVWDQVTALTGEIRSSSLSCDWIGPPWGTDNPAFGKTTGRVQELSDYLAQIVSPCHYVNSTAFAAPGAWKSIDGQHLDQAGYKAWTAAIVKSIEAQQANPAPAAPAAGAASDDAPW
ncbi:SGNH/GDSL hydrolase family protein [Zavarzinia compransoris]|uniref:SGNH/GDSL hydrolase family protein n=1 Tax=Zavarzinia marina TaxID=2911065 RepID=UPI001F34AB27|nr:SGNH/GDSL hydrolase family protein [Zavarzinia marina]MCF4164836.1 SGNH/GDSL hydrolase family protein [Zavarzinia marina]